MKQFVNKISLVFISMMLVFSSCEVETSLEVTSPDPTFVLDTPGITSILLNFDFPNNPAFTVTWKDQLTTGSTYKVEMSKDDQFTTPITLGTTQKSNFSMTVADFNTIINNAGLTQTVDLPVYMRVNNGTENSNSILLLVTVYPTGAQSITAPIANAAYTLNFANASQTALTVNWTDVTTASYTLEAAPTNAFTSPVSLGTTSNKTIAVKTEDLNTVALGAGIAPAATGNLYIRIKSSIASATGGNPLVRLSAPVLIRVTPYNVNFPYLYLVGDATTPGWNPNNNNTAVFRSQDTPNFYYYTGYFKSGSFKILETTNWQPQWGTNNGTTLAVNPGNGSDPGTFNVATAGYYTYTFSSMTAGASYTVTPYNATGKPTYGVVGIIGDATPNGWGSSTNMTKDPNNPHLWYLNNVRLENGKEFLIRADNNWNDVWRYKGSTQLFGKAELAGGGLNFPFTGATGNYNFWFNDLDGSYVIIPR